MPSLTSSLEDAIHRAIGFANARRHELATLEHLLLALMLDENDQPDPVYVDLVAEQLNTTSFLRVTLPQMTIQENEAFIEFYQLINDKSPEQTDSSSAK